MNWNEFTQHLEAMQNGSGAQKLAAEQARLEGLIENARKAKIELQEFRTIKADIEAKTAELEEKRGLLERAERELADRTTQIDAREALIESKNRAFVVEMAKKTKALELEESRLERLRETVNQNNSAVQEKMDHLKAAGVM